MFGSVTSLSGDPEPGVVVEAIGMGAEKCHQMQEESTTEANGQFRIRGLHPQVCHSSSSQQAFKLYAVQAIYLFYILNPVFS